MRKPVQVLVNFGFAFTVGQVQLADLQIRRDVSEQVIHAGMTGGLQHGFPVGIGVGDVRHG